MKHRGKVLSIFFKWFQFVCCVRVKRYRDRYPCYIQRVGDEYSSRFDSERHKKNGYMTKIFVSTKLLNQQCLFFVWKPVLALLFWVQYYSFLSAQISVIQKKDTNMLTAVVKMFIERRVVDAGVYIYTENKVVKTNQVERASNSNKCAGWGSFECN